MKLTQRLTAGALTLVLSAGLFAMPLAAQADRRDRNGIVLGAAAAALLLGQRDKTAGIIVAAGVALAATRGDSDRYGDRYYSDRDYRYDDRYNRSRYNDDRYTRDYNYNSDRSYRSDDRYDRNRNRNDRDRDDRYNRDRGNYDRSGRDHDRNDRYDRDRRR